MHFLVFILLLNVAYVRAQSDDHGTCTIWGDPHLVGFPVDPLQAPLRSGYWCQWAGRLLIVKNEFIEFYVNVTETPYWNEYYEITLFNNQTKLCTITPNYDDCPRDGFVTINHARNSPNAKQVYYEEADIDIDIFSTSINNRLVYNIDVTQNYSLILASQGLCINRLPQCTIETAPGRRKRTTSLTTATDACNVFVEESKFAAQQIVGNITSPMIDHAREACITDILLTNNPEWGATAVWFVLTDSIRQSSLSRDEQGQKLTNISSNIAEVMARAQPRAESVMGISTTTTTSSISTESFSSVSTTISTGGATTKNSSASTLPLMSIIILLCLTLSVAKLNFN